MFDGINFGDLVKNSPIRQIKILTKVSDYTVASCQECTILNSIGIIISDNTCYVTGANN